MWWDGCCSPWPRRLLPPLKRKLWRYLNPDAAEAVLTRNYLTLVLMALFASCLVTRALGVFSMFGAFLMGVALHKETSLVTAWRQKFSDFVLVALVPIFFTNTGLQTEIGLLKTGTAWFGCGLILAVAIAGKLGGCYAGARFTGQARQTAACLGALMNTRGLMGLVAINVGLELGLLNRELFTMFIIMALFTTGMTGPLLRLWLPPELRPPAPGTQSHPS
jgi:Kef-type K+ transport system membrane component KefB